MRHCLDNIDYKDTICFSGGCENLRRFYSCIENEENCETRAKLRRIISKDLFKIEIYVDNRSRLMSFEHPTMFLTHTERILCTRRERMRMMKAIDLS